MRRHGARDRSWPSALHIAAAQVFSEALGELAMLSFDARVRDNALALGMSVLPAE